MIGGRFSRGGLPEALLAGGVILVAINLRPAAASIGPVIHRIQSGTGLSSGWAGALVTLPVLCFGLLAPLAPVLARRLSVPGSVAVAMIVLLAGLLMRLLPGVGFLFFGTALAGAAIAIGNVLMPVLVRRDFAHRTGTVMALYSSSLIAFAALAAGVTVPLADGLGGGWRPGLAVWAAPAAVAAVAWLPALRHRSRIGSVSLGPAGDPHPGHTVRALLRSRLAWAVTLFFALQSGGFYATLAWLPSIFRSHGASEAHAGLLLSLTMVVGLFTALTVPGLANRSRGQRPLVIVSCALTAAGFAGILLSPMSAPYLWTVLLGLGQNATFPLALMLIVLRGGGVATTESLSTLAQSLGYALAAFAPLAVGAIHGAAGSWTPALIVLLVLVAPQALVGLAAGADRELSARVSDRDDDEADLGSKRPPPTSADQKAPQRNPEKEPAEWVTGREPATGPQLSYVGTPSRETGVEAPANRTTTDASRGPGAPQVLRLQPGRWEACQLRRPMRRKPGWTPGERFCWSASRPSSASSWARSSSSSAAVIASSCSRATPASSASVRRPSSVSEIA